MESIDFDICDDGSKPPSSPGVYCLVHEGTGQYYIGSTSNLRRRFHEHTSGLRNSKHANTELQNTFADGSIPVFGYNDNHGYYESVQIETDLIKNHQSSTGLMNKLSTNKPFSDDRRSKISEALQGHVVAETTRAAVGMAATGNKYWVGKTHTEETKEKLRAAHQGNTYAKGHTKTPEGIAKIRATHLGRQHSDEARLRVSMNSAKARCVIIDGVEYRNLTVAGDALGVSGDTIRRRCLDARFETYNFG
ncbi:GIY-YIG catalytic domain protein [compost metagenome]